MINEKFIKEVIKSYKRSTMILQKKALEYSEEGDRLGQFYRIAKRRMVNPCETLMGMAAKHYDSIELMAKDPFEYSLDEWNEKVTDLRNYTFLLDALLRDMDI